MKWSMTRLLAPPAAHPSCQPRVSLGQEHRGVAQHFLEHEKVSAAAHPARGVGVPEPVGVEVGDAGERPHPLAKEPGIPVTGAADPPWSSSSSSAGRGTQRTFPFFDRRTRSSPSSMSATCARTISDQRSPCPAPAGRPTHTARRAQRTSHSSSVSRFGPSPGSSAAAAGDDRRRPPPRLRRPPGDGTSHPRTCRTVDGERFRPFRPG